MPKSTTHITVKRVPLKALHEDPANARRHDERNLAAIRASLLEYGQVEPLVVQAGTGRVIGGNGRLQVMRSLGWTAASIVELPLDDLAATSLAIALNRTSELASWDNKVLHATLTQLTGSGVDVDKLLGFASKDLDDLLATLDPTPELTDPPIPEAPQGPPQTRQGDTWILGPHRLTCGSSRDDEDVARMLGTATVNLVITSPPYAKQREYDQDSSFKPVPPDEYVTWYEPVSKIIQRRLTADGSYFLNLRAHCEEGQRHLYTTDLLLTHVRKWGWRFVDDFAWIHGGTPMQPQGRFKNAWEPIWHFTIGKSFKFNPEAVRHPSRSRPTALIPGPDGGDGSHPSQVGRRLAQGRPSKLPSSNAKRQGRPGGGHQIMRDVGFQMMAYPSNVLSLGRNREAIGHPAAFPTNLPAFFIRAYTDPGDTIYDPFLGSGTTLMAAEQLGRRCFGMEISPTYCDLILQRWTTHTGKTPKTTRGRTYKPPTA